MKSLIMAFIVLLAAAQNTCDIYNCTTLDKGQCSIMKDEGNHMFFELMACPESQVCDLHFEAEPDVCMPSYTAPLLYPGEYCLNNTECYSGICTASVCIGKKVDGECSEDSQCDAKLYCDAIKKVCIPAKKKGENCGEQERCDVSLVCNNNTCIDIGSLELDVQATAFAACKSFYLFDGKCAVGPKLERGATDPKEGPIVCTKECVYSGLENFTKPCSCGKTTNGTAFCNPGKGDIKLDDVSDL